MYAIMICLDNKDDWIFITEDTQDCLDLRPLLFDDIHDALLSAEQWAARGKEENVKVVSYNY